MGRKAYGNLVEFENKSVLFIDANHLPHFKEGGYSMERRITVIPFPATFDKRNIDLHMSQKLAHKSCQTAILSWLIEGALYYISFGLLPTKRVQEATAEYFSSENTIKMFLKEATTEDVSGKVYFSDLYSAYEYYCKQNILQPKSKDVFSKSAEIKKYPNKKDGINRYRQGIRLKTEYENISEKEN